MAVFATSESFSLEPLLRHGFVGSLYSCHDRKVTPNPLRFHADGSLTDAVTSQFLNMEEDGRVLFSDRRQVYQVEIHDDRRGISIKCDGKYLCAMRDGAMKTVPHRRAWERFELCEVQPFATIAPSRALSSHGDSAAGVPPKVGALSVLLSLRCLFRLRCVHGGLVTTASRCDGRDENAAAVEIVLFRIKKRLATDRFLIETTARESAQSDTLGAKLFPAQGSGDITAELRIGGGGMAKMAISMIDQRYPVGFYLRADPNGELTERVGVAEEWENFTVECTTQSVDAGYRELERKRKATGATASSVGKGPTPSSSARAEAAKPGPRTSETARKVAPGYGAQTTASTSSSSAPSRKTGGNGFNFSAALSGAAEVAPTPKASASTAPAEKASAQTNGKATNGEVTSSSSTSQPNSRRSKKKQRKNRKGASNGKAKKATPSTAPVAAAPRPEPARAEDDSVITVSSLSSSPEDREVAKPKDPCFACGRNLEGSIVEAKGHRYHTQCFVCFFCRRPLSGGKFHEDKGRSMCELCYKTKVAPRCSRCSEGILGTVTTALGTTWHPGCFLCRRCGNPILDYRFYVLPHKPNEPFCGTCHGMRRTSDGPQFTLARVGPFNS